MSICTQTNTSQQKLDACEAYFGERHCRTITFDEDDVDGGQAGGAIDLNVINENYQEDKYLIYFYSEIVGEPAPEDGQTVIKIEDFFDETKEELAATFAAAIAELPVKIEVSGNKVHIRNKFLGGITPEADRNEDQDFKLETNIAGFGGSLGAFAPGGASLSTEVTVEQVFSDQQGEILLDEIIKGMTISLEVTLAEMTQARWESLIGNVSGGIVTVSGSKLVGYGTGKLFQSKFQYAGMLVLHPIALPNSDRSSDYVIHKTSPDMSSINFSGSELQGAEMVFNAYRDTSVNSAIDLFSKGDYTLL
jgi:hypothetical protein